MSFKRKKEKKTACRAEAKTRQEAGFGFRFWQREPLLRIFPRRRGQDAAVACDYSEWHAALAKKGWDCCHGDTLWVAMATECNHGDSHGECDGRGLLFITSHPECNTGLGTLLRTHKGWRWRWWRWRWWWWWWWSSWWWRWRGWWSEVHPHLKVPCYDKFTRPMFSIIDASGAPQEVQSLLLWWQHTRTLSEFLFVHPPGCGRERLPNMLKLQ